jgi:hypothetical protein
MSDFTQIKKILEASGIQFVAQDILNATGNTKFKEISIAFEGLRQGVGIEFTLAGKLRGFTIWFKEK